MTSVQYYAPSEKAAHNLKKAHRFRDVMDKQMLDFLDDDEFFTTVTHEYDWDTAAPNSWESGDAATYAGSQSISGSHSLSTSHPMIRGGHPDPYNPMTERVPAACGAPDPTYSLDIELNWGPSEREPDLTGPPVTVCLRNFWPARNVLEAQYVLDRAGFPLLASSPRGIAAIQMPLDIHTGRIRGICYVLTRSAGVAEDLIATIRGSTLTAPNQSRGAGQQRGARVRYIISADVARRQLSVRPQGLADHIAAEDAMMLTTR